jgi:hypothetical protein
MVDRSTREAALTRSRASNPIPLCMATTQPPRLPVNRFPARARPCACSIEPRSQPNKDPPRSWHEKIMLKPGQGGAGWRFADLGAGIVEELSTGTRTSSSCRVARLSADSARRSRPSRERVGVGPGDVRPCRVMRPRSSNSLSSPTTLLGLGPRAKRGCRRWSYLEIVGNGRSAAEQDSGARSGRQRSKVRVARS